MKDIFKILREAKKNSEGLAKDFEKEIMKDPEGFVKKLLDNNPELVNLKEV